jgi:hypothetical protein
VTRNIEPPALPLTLSWLERNVKKYQVYSITEDGAVIGNREIEATSDDEAVYAVRAMQRPHHTEIWHRDRRVAKVAPHSRLS